MCNNNGLLISPLSVDGFVLLVVLVLASTPRVVLEGMANSRENQGNVSNTPFWCPEKSLDEIMKVGRSKQAFS